MDYKIEDDVPIPSNGHRPGTKVAAILALLPGQSVLFPGSVNANGSGVAKVSKQTGRRFTCRAVKGGVRVWRLPDEENAR